MDTLHTVLRTIRGDARARDHLDIFREFLGHLDRLGRRPFKRAPAQKRARPPRRRPRR